MKAKTDKNKTAAGSQNAHYSSYGWLITEDFTADESNLAHAGGKGRVGVSGPATISDEMLAKLKAGDGIEFQMRDDDGGYIYAGRFIGDWESEDGFGPLDDSGKPDAGCTSIEYKNAAGEWEAL